MSLYSIGDAQYKRIKGSDGKVQYQNISDENDVLTESLFNQKITDSKNPKPVEPKVEAPKSTETKPVVSQEAQKTTSTENTSIMTPKTYTPSQAPTSIGNLLNGGNQNNTMGDFSMGGYNAGYEVDPQKFADSSMKFGLFASLGAMMPFGLGGLFSGGFTGLVNNFAKAITFKFDFSNYQAPTFQQFQTPTYPQNTQQAVVQDSVPENGPPVKVEETTVKTESESPKVVDEVKAERKAETKAVEKAQEQEAVQEQRAITLAEVAVEKGEMKGVKQEEIHAALDAKGYKSTVQSFKSGGAKVEYTDEAGNKRAVSFNKENKPFFVKLPKGRIDYKYDANGNLAREIKVTQINNRYLETEVTEYNADGTKKYYKKVKTDRGNVFTREKGKVKERKPLEETYFNQKVSEEPKIELPEFKSGQVGLSYDPAKKTLENSEFTWTRDSKANYVKTNKDTGEKLTYDKKGNLVKQEIIKKETNVIKDYKSGGYVDETTVYKYNK